MCGICGILYSDPRHPADEAGLRAMVAKLVRRGPDDEGVHVAPGVALGHRRLSVIDLAGGHQPMASDDESLVLVYNGEVFNYRELMREIEGRGRKFRTKCDTEVVLRAYEEWGEACVERLNGQFAFAIYDAKERGLFLARDRFGEKPLFYFADGERFVFASTLASLLEAGGVPREVDREALELYLTFGYIGAPRTIFKGVSKVPPGTTLTVRGDAISAKRYWEPPCEVGAGDSDAGKLADELVELLTDSVRMRLVADVPLGAFLSGGVDSSAVVALMSGLVPEPVRTFSIGFADPLYNELDYAGALAARCRTQHRPFLVEPRFGADVLGTLVEVFGEPFADSSAIPTFYLAERTREHVKVALAGDGGDELFGGYDRYRALRLSGLFDACPARLRRGLARFFTGHLFETGEQRSAASRIARFASQLEMDPVERYIAWISLFDAASREALLTEDFRKSLDGFRAEDTLREAFARHASGDAPARAMAADLETYLPGDLMVKTDVASMAWGLEVRNPFLDHRLAEFACRVPTKLKLSSRRGKLILRRAFADKLPGSILRRGKMGFGVPMGKWFRGELSGLVRDVLLDPRTIARGVLKKPAVESLITDHANGRADNSVRLYALMFLETWWRKFVDG